MRGMSKSGTLDLLESHGMNTVERVVLKKPFVANQLINQLIKFPHDMVSIRSWKSGQVLCPFYPNRPITQLLQIVNDEWDKLKKMDEIIFAQGINPDQSHMAGKVMDNETEIHIEYFNGPGTVRKLDTITPLVKSFPKKGVLLTKPFKDWAPLYIAAKAFFCSYPHSIIEWSYYPYKIGKLQENYIYWEVI